MVNVTVIGAGNAGFALACHLSLTGHQVALFEHPNFKQVIEPVHTEGCIVASAEEDGYKAAVHGTANIPLATTDIAEAMKFGDIVALVVPAFGQLPMFELMMPHLRDGQIVVCMPGNYASLEFARTMQEKGGTQQVAFVDTNSVPHACRKLQQPPNGVFISGIKLRLTAGVYPAARTDEIFEKLKGVIPGNIFKADNVLQAGNNLPPFRSNGSFAGFANASMIFHPPPILLNAGWIEMTGGDFKFYTEGCSPSICRVMMQVDAERMAIAEALGLSTQDIVTIYKQSYGETGYPTLYESIHNSAHYGYIKAPPSLGGRYIVEDLCFNLIPISEVGKKRGIQTPTIDTLVHLASVMTGEKMASKRTLDFVCKDGESKEQLRARL